ncbi:MAG: ABC transporter permease [Peptococcaceae bacterium]|nr:ABC transporter permease [Peptococcaceae bacterium]
MRIRLFVFSTGTLAVLGLLVAAAPLLTGYDPAEVDLLHVLQPPGPGHLMGTDQLGRDVWARLLYGGRVSMLVGLASVLLSLGAGVLYGAVSGYLGGAPDRLMMRVVDALLCLPGILIMMVVQSLSRPGLFNVIMVIGLTSWMQTARLVRTEILALKEREFVVAARAAGTSAWRIIHSHLVPHAAPTIIVMGAVGVGHAIMSEATLSFLGLGIPPHQPSWGNMLIGGQNHILSGAWWVVFFPGIMIVATVLSVTFLGDVLQDVLAPGRNWRKEVGLPWLRNGRAA